MKISGNKKGISLIVLIITIVVIIVLATAIILSIANNRPIESAKEATASHNDSVLKESATVLSAQWETDSLLNKTSLPRSEYVKQGLSSQGFTQEEAEDIVVDNETGKVGIKGGAVDVASNPDTYYGKEVEYKENSDSKVSWKIFYADETNIYLIASDYIPYSAVPQNSKGHKPNEITSGDVSYECDAEFTNILQDYAGSESITDSKLQNLNSSYFAYLKSSGNKSTNNNMKDVAYMLDTNAWKVFAGEDAEYAIGGPTVEMFIKSYNQKHPDSKLEYQVTDVKGYSYRNGSSGSWSTYISSAFDTGDNLYVIKDYKKAFGMWLASPSANAVNDLGYVHNNNGGLNGSGNCYSIGLGFRPLVCLKSSIKLEESGSGYIIK